MAYVEPNGIVRLCTGVPLDTSQRNQLYFASSSAQETYFTGKAAITMEAQTYTRIQRGIFRMRRTVDNANQVYNINYMMFRNTEFQTKWFYAFVTAVEYVNNNCYEVHFEIDPIQTYWFNISLNQCFVERAHAAEDTIGEHTLPEPVDIGDYVVASELGDIDYLFDDYSVLVGYVNPEGTGDISSTYINGQFSGVLYKSFRCNNYAQASAIGSFLNDFTSEDPDKVVSLMYVPTGLIQDGGEAGGGQPYSQIWIGPVRPGNIQNHTPRNNKLLTYPYICLRIHNGDGDAQILKFEDFTGSYGANPATRFEVTAAMASTPEVMLAPVAYGNDPDGGNGKAVNYNYKIGISDFPQCAYVIDTYRAWLAQHTGQRTVERLSAAGGSILQAAGGNPAEGVANFAQLTFNQMAQDSDAMAMPNRVKGSQTSSAMVAGRKLRFYIEVLTIKDEYARCIDDFFDRFGYRLDRIQTPHVHTRAQWNYVKTRGSCVTGNAPADDLAYINRCFDNGITFWNNPENVGNYSLSNGIL